MVILEISMMCCKKFGKRSQTSKIKHCVKSHHACLIGNAKFDHHKPRWTKPKMPQMEKATYKPALANFTTENPSNGEELKEEEDV
jgi:hypothetical protein